jgi:Flp pilus assembly protein TadD
MVALRPDHWTGHNRVAMAHFRSGRSEHAIAPWQRVLELTPDNAVALANLGAAQFQVGRLDEALACYTRAVAMSPTATASAGAGTVLFFLGRHAEAVAMLERAVRLSPLDARAWGNLADAQRWAAGMEVESRASFDHAIALAQEQTRKNPGDAENLARLALWLSKRGRPAEGVATVRRACELAPAHAGVLGRAVSVHLLAGDEACARECLAQALARGYSWVELLRDPELEPLRKDPGTRELLRRAETTRREALARAEATGEES